MTRPSSDRPSGRELAAAVREFLQNEVLPTSEDDRLRFRTRVAMNALSIVERELPPPQPPNTEEMELARRIRAGDIRETDLATISHKVEERLRIASPGYLERYQR